MGDRVSESSSEKGNSSSKGRSNVVTIHATADPNKAAAFVHKRDDTKANGKVGLIKMPPAFGAEGSYERNKEQSIAIINMGDEKELMKTVRKALKKL